MKPQHQRFVQEYRVDFNGAKAAIRAGYSARRAKQAASELLAREDVQAELAKVMKAHAVKAETRADKAAKELEGIAFMAMSDQASMLNVKRAALVDLLKLDGKFIERKEVKRVDDFSNMTDEELNQRIVEEAGKLGLGDLGALFPKPNGKAH